MDTIQIIALIWLAFVFGISLWQHINLGLIMIPASFILALFADMPLKALYGSFPAKLALLVLGVMYLWNHVQESGFAAIIVKKAIALARGRVYLLPWIIHILAAIICAVGALPAAAFAITVPVALEIAKRERISPTLMGIILIQGSCVGGFTLFNPWGNLVAEQAANAGIPIDPLWLFISQGIVAIAVAFVAFFVFGGLELIRRPIVQSNANEDSQNSTGPLTRYQICSFIGLISFILLALLKFDVGLTAFTIGMILQIAFRIKSKTVLSKLPWGIVIMISGIENPSLVRFGVTIIGTILANFESSSIAVLGLVIPVAVKSMAGSIDILANSLSLGVLSACLVVMCSSPFHIGGALILSEAEDYDKTFRHLLIWVVVLTLTMPFLTFLL